MFTYFRRIRKGLLDMGAARKYLLYAIGEIALVVIGILIALQINNWNERRLERSETLKVLTDIRNALTSDLSLQFDKHIKRIQRDIKDIDIVFFHLSNKRPYQDSLDKYFSVISKGGGRNWTPQTSAYKVLESKGVDIIKSDTLKSTILNIYNLHYPSITYNFENYKRNVYDYGRPLAREKFNTGTGMFTMDQSWISAQFLELKPVDYTALSNNVEFMNIIKILKMSALIDRNILQEKRIQVEHAIGLINNHLANNF